LLLFAHHSRRCTSSFVHGPPAVLYRTEANYSRITWHPPLHLSSPSRSPSLRRRRVDQPREEKARIAKAPRREAARPTLGALAHGRRTLGAQRGRERSDGARGTLRGALIEHLRPLSHTACKGERGCLCREACLVGVCARARCVLAARRALPAAVPVLRAARHALSSVEARRGVEQRLESGRAVEVQHPRRLMARAVVEGRRRRGVGG
jgi:hypothetical protein